MLTFLAMALVVVCVVGLLWPRAVRAEREQTLDLDYQARRELNAKLAAIARKRLADTALLNGGRK